MATLALTIDNYIGSWAYSKQWLKEMLKGHEKDQINLTISSLGGSVDHALAMHEILKTHGNVHVKLTGFNASAATIIAMGAKTRSISKYAFFLVHKVMSWIDEFGYMNEDDIEALVERLTKEKNENGKMTLALAQIYHDETGKPTKDLLNLMKQNTWLNAEEAQDWGFVNEIYTPAPEEKAAMYSLAKVAMITANGLPEIPNHENNDNHDNTDSSIINPQSSIVSPDGSAGLVSAIISGIAEIFKTKNPKMKKQFVNINQLIGVETLEASEEGVFLNQEQLDTIDQQVAQVPTITQERDTLNTQLAETTTQRDQITNERDTLNTQLAETTSQRDGLQNQLTQNNSALDQIDDTVANAATIEEKIQAIRNLLAKKPAAAPAGQHASTDPNTDKNDGVDWETLNSLPHMQEE